MKVLLLDNIKGLGQIGDVKNVSDGYARNYLLPRKIAKAANEASLKEMESLKKKLAAMEIIERENAQKIADKIRDSVIELTRKATKTGKLFAGIDKEDLVKEIKKAWGVELKEEMIGHEEPIKHVGEHLVDINFLSGLKAQIKVVVKAE